MLDGNSDLLVAKGKPVGPSVILESRAYTALMRAVRIGMPAATIGGLIGRRELSFSQEEERFVIEETEPVKLVHLGATMGPDLTEWAKLKAEVEDSEHIDSEIVGWYYADAAISDVPALIDSSMVQQTLRPDAGILLLIDPAAEEGAFFLWRDGKFIPAGGFYEALPYSGAPSIIPWHGKVIGAAQWVGLDPDEAPSGDKAPTDNKAELESAQVEAKPEGWWIAPEVSFSQPPNAASNNHAVPDGLDSLVEKAAPVVPIAILDGQEDGTPTAPEAAMEPQAPDIPVTIDPSRVQHALTAGVETQAIEVIPKGERWAGELAPLFDMGQAAYERGSWVEAEKALSEVARRDPNYVRNGQSAAEMASMAELFRLGVAAYQRENWQKAREYLREIVRLQPKSEIHRQLAAQVLVEVEDRIAAERRKRLRWVVAASIVPLLCLGGILSALVLPAGAPLHAAVFGATTTPIAEAQPLTGGTQGPASNGSAPAQPAETPPGEEEPTAVAIVVAPSATPLPPTPTEVPPEPTATATTGPPPAVVARGKVLAAVEALRMGQFEAAIENQDGSLATARVQFDLGEGERQPAYHILTLYENRNQTYSIERIAIGEEAWQRMESGRWSEVAEQEGAWGQLQTFLPRTLSVASPTLEETSTGNALLRWSESSESGEITLFFDPVTGVPKEMQRLYGPNGSKLTVSYIEWNTPVEIVPPDVP